MDRISLDRLQTLHPLIRQEAVALWAKVEAALTGRAMARVTFGLRTMTEQKAIYEQGRTKPGPIVTNAPPGSSYHNWGLAFDFALVIDGKIVSWDIGKDFDGDNVADWMEVVKIFKAAGWEWGGDWKSLKDYPHLQKTMGHNWRDLLAQYNAGHTKDGYVFL